MIERIVAFYGKDEGAITPIRTLNVALQMRQLLLWVDLGLCRQHCRADGDAGDVRAGFHAVPLFLN